MFYAILVSSILAVVAPGVSVTPKNDNGASSSSNSSSHATDSEDSDADPSGTGEVGEDIIIEDEIDTNDDEGVSN